MDTNNPQIPNTTQVPAPPSPLPPPSGSYGAVIAIVVIVAIVIVGAFYVWGERVSEDRSMPTDEQSSEAGPALSDSNDLGALQADLAATSVTGVDEGLSSADQHIEENQ